MPQRFPPLAPQEPMRSRFPAVVQALPLGELGLFALIGLVLLLA
ncbi:hypothetical protein [Cypionkella sp.]|nr:hypothetical protein [Cypionkella sp.]